MAPSGLVEEVFEVFLVDLTIPKTEDTDGEAVNRLVGGQRATSSKNRKVSWNPVSSTKTDVNRL